jgi:molybdate transport system substrate-binding protein
MKSSSSARAKATIAAVLIAVVAPLVAVGLAPAAGLASGSSSATPISVAAAQELSAAFQSIDTAPEYSFADPGLLANSLSEGAPADVFAGTAAAAQALARTGTVGKPVKFATMRMVLIVPSSNPAHVGAASALARSGVSLELGRPGFSFGDEARSVLARLGLRAVAARSRSVARSPEAVVQAVAAGRADAGLVYAPDLGAAAGRVRVIPLPARANPSVTLEIAVASRSPQPTAAAAFVREVRSRAGRAALRAAGFGAP